MVYGQIIWETEYSIPGRYGLLTIRNEFDNIKDCDSYIAFLTRENPDLRVTLTDKIV